MCVYFQERALNLKYFEYFRFTFGNDQTIKSSLENSFNFQIEIPLNIK
jgi:hypothetical protein